MKIEGKDLLPFIEDALPGMQLRIEESFTSDRVNVTVSYNRYVVVSLDYAAIAETKGESGLVDALSKAAQKGCKILRSDIKGDVA